MSVLLQSCNAQARAAGDAARRVFRRGTMIGVAALIAMLGAGFVIFASYLGLRFLLGPGYAALALGGTLLAMAAGLLLIAQNPGRTSRPYAFSSHPQLHLSVLRSRPTDAAAMAVFTVAFLLGRRLADRRGPSSNS